MTEPEVTPAAEFRAMRERGVLQTLPSGRVVRLRTVTPDRLLREGKIPDILTPLVLRMVYEDVPNAQLDEFLATRERVADALAMIESLRVVCVAGLLEPRIVDEPEGKGDISIDDLTLNERGWVFKLVFQSAETLSSFRFGQTPDVDTLPNGEGDSQPTE